MIKGSKILAIIPARGGSKGVPRKNIKELRGKPLIAYTIEAAKESKYIDRIVVSTENEEIAKISKGFGAEVPYLRPREFAQDSSPTVDCVIDTVKYLKEKENYNADYICLLQCTSPLRTKEDIDGTIEKLMEIDMDGIISICEAEVNPYWTNVFEGDKLEYFLQEGKKITRRQELPTVYRLNGAIYIVKTDTLIKENTFEPKKLTGYVMKNENSIDIDTLLDFYICETILKEREKNA